MNPLSRSVSLLVTSLLLSIPMLSSAAADLGGTSGGSHGGGGSSSNLKTALNRKYRECTIHTLELAVRDSFFRRNLFFFLETLDPALLADVQARTRLQEMKARGFKDDLKKTKLRLSHHCTDRQGIARSATTAFEMGATICLNPERIVDDLGLMIPDSILYGLMAHEFAHHFNFTDSVLNELGEEIYPLGSAVAEYFEAETRRLEQSGMIGNSFVRPGVCESPSFENELKTIRYEVEF